MGRRMLWQIPHLPSVPIMAIHQTHGIWRSGNFIIGVKISGHEIEKKMVEIDSAKRTMAFGSKATEEDNNSSGKESVRDFSAAEEADDVFNIQKFIKCRTQQGKMLIFVKWEGGDTTWEPEANL